jgi:hypothetical protein
MTNIDSLRQLVERGRALPGQWGLRVFRVYVVTRHWSGDRPGEGGTAEDPTELLVGGQPPKVRTLSGETIAVEQLPSDTLEIGPLTPEFSGGGIDLDLLKGELWVNDERWLLLTGPGMGDDGTRFRIVSVRADKALRYVIRAAPLSLEK